MTILAWTAALVRCRFMNAAVLGLIFSLILLAAASAGEIKIRRGPIQALSLDSTKLGANSVDSDKIVNAAISTTKLNTDSVTNAKVLKGSIDSTKLFASTAVDTGKLTCSKADGKFGYCSGFTRSPNAWECDCN